MEKIQFNKVYIKKDLNNPNIYTYAVPHMISNDWLHTIRFDDLNAPPEYVKKPIETFLDSYQLHTNRTIDEVWEGDELIYNKQNKDLTLTILQRDRNVVWIAKRWGWDNFHEDILYKSILMLKEQDFKIKQPEPKEPTELTLEQIAEKFNVPIEQLRIKDKTN